MKPNIFPPGWLFELNRQLKAPFTAARGVWCGTDAVALLASAVPCRDQPDLVDLRITLAPEAVRLRLPLPEGEQVLRFFKPGLRPSKSRATRVAACMALGKLATSAAQVELRRLVENEPDELVRVAAINALHKVNRPVVAPSDLAELPLRLVIRGEAGEEIMVEQATDATGLAVFPSVPESATCQLQWVVPAQCSGLLPLLEGLQLVASGSAVLENENWKVLLDFQSAEAGRTGDLVVQATPLTPAAESEAPLRFVVQVRAGYLQPMGNWRERKLHFPGIRATEAALRAVPAQLAPPAGEERAFAALSPPVDLGGGEPCEPVVVRSPEHGLVSLLERTADGRVRVTVETEYPPHAGQALVCSLGAACGRMVLAPVKEGVWRGTTVLDRAWGDAISLGAIAFQLAKT